MVETRCSGFPKISCIVDALGSIDKAMTSPAIYPQSTRTSGLAIGSMVVGFFSVCLPVISPVAIILGHFALSGIKKSNGSVNGGGLAICGLAFGYLGLLIGIVVYSLFFAALSGAKQERQQEKELFSIPSFDHLTYPDLKERQAIDGSAVVFYDLSLNGRGPAGRTQLRVYVPPGNHGDTSMACALVAPAGTNLLSGVDLDGSDYHDEALPYAEAGVVVVTYSLDGAADDDLTIEADDLRSYATAVDQTGGDVELKTVPSGGHYNYMIEDGIPAGIEWIKERLSD